MVQPRTTDDAQMPATPRDWFHSGVVWRRYLAKIDCPQSFWGQGHRGLPWTDLAGQGCPKLFAHITVSHEGVKTLKCQVTLRPTFNVCAVCGDALHIVKRNSCRFNTTNSRLHKHGRFYCVFSNTGLLHRVCQQTLQIWNVYYTFSVSRMYLCFV